MEIEQEVLEIATLTSNAFGWKSEIAGHIGMVGVDDEGAHQCESENEYVKEILNFFNNLPHLDLSGFEGLTPITDFVKRSAAASRERLEALARADWKDRLGE